MTRMLLALMAGLLCGMAGCKYAAALQADAIRLKCWDAVLKRLLLLLREGIHSIPEALRTAAGDHSSPDELLRRMSAWMIGHPAATCAEAFDVQACRWQEKDILSTLFSGIGHGSKESRCLAVEQAMTALAFQAQQAAARAEKDVRLWQTLGLTGGICLTMLLL